MWPQLLTDRNLEIMLHLQQSSDHDSDLLLCVLFSMDMSVNVVHLK